MQAHFVNRYQMPFCHLCGLSVLLLASSKLLYGVCSMSCLFPFLSGFPELSYSGRNGQAQDQREVPLLCSLQMWCFQPMRVSFPLKNLTVANFWTIEDNFFVQLLFCLVFTNEGLVTMNKPFRGHFFFLLFFESPNKKDRISGWMECLQRHLTFQKFPEQTIN